MLSLFPEAAKHEVKLHYLVVQHDLFQASPVHHLVENQGVHPDVVGGEVHRLVLLNEHIRAVWEGQARTGLAA